MLAALLAVMAVVYSNCAPAAEAEDREGENEEGQDQLFYNIFCKF